MIDLMILGFLADGPLHGYELRRKMEQLHGHARKISDGTLYPAIKRLAKAGFLGEQVEPGVGSVPRKTLSLTATGRERLESLLRGVEGQDLTDLNSFFVVLAFLAHLPDPAERRAVLQRRLDFLEQPASFFTSGGRALKSAEITDPYRRGIFVTAKAANSAQRAWLCELLEADSE
ncbi:PadR family transcriptional regulator [Glutamicibacter sp. NPDC127525]|uniref:PadR family transcriptional regulator n=1 Tax=unclassified Glutamicibacter TaxID=2627139 RepID=UPI003644562D